MSATRLVAPGRSVILSRTGYVHAPARDWRAEPVTHAPARAASLCGLVVGPVLTLTERSHVVVTRDCATCLAALDREAEHG